MPRATIVITGDIKNPAITDRYVSETIVLSDTLDGVAFAPTDEPVYEAGVSSLIFAGDSSSPLYADLTASGALVGGATGSVTRLFPAPSPLSGYLISGGSPAVSTTRNGIVSDGESGKAFQNKYPPNAGPSQDASYMYLCVPASSGLMPAENTPVRARWQQKFAGTLNGVVFAIKNIHFLLNGAPGGGQPQINTHGASPGPPLPTGKYITLQFYDNAYNDGTQPTGNQGNQPRSPFWQDMFNDGLFHLMTAEYKRHTSSGVKDGYCRMWIDHTKVIDVSQATVGVTPPDGYKTWCTQDHVDNMHTTLGWGDAQCLLFWGGVRSESLDNVQQATIDYRIGNGDPTDDQTFTVWTD